MSEETTGSILVKYLLNTLTHLPESHTRHLGILPGSALFLPAADPVLVFDLHSRPCCVISCDVYQGLLHYMNPLSHTASWTSASSSKIKTDLIILDPLKATELFILSDSCVSVQGLSSSAPGWVPSSPVLTACVLSLSTFIRKCISDGSTETHRHAPRSFPFMRLKCKSEIHSSTDIVNDCGSDGCSGTYRSVLSLSLEFLQDRCPRAVTLTDMGPMADWVLQFVRNQQLLALLWIWKRSLLTGLGVLPSTLYSMEKVIHFTWLALSGAHTETSTRRS